MPAVRLCAVTDGLEALEHPGATKMNAIMATMVTTNNRRDISELPDNNELDLTKTSMSPFVMNDECDPLC
jgi:hypothetical protein